MTTRISGVQLQRLGDSVARRLGLHFPAEHWLDLERAVCAAAQECGYPGDLDQYVEELLLPNLRPGRLEALASHLTVGETYFFREKQSLKVLEGNIVPELIRARMGSGRAIRIWSAGCATGEEPYSLAIVLSKLMGLNQSEVEILATDLNPKSLRKASEGIYRDWSFRGTPPWVRGAYFDGTGGDTWAVKPAIKKMVSFAPLNLMDDAYLPFTNYPNGFDVIFCRNVLMYFTREAMRKVIRQLHCALASDGWLIVSPTETSQELFSEFATVNLGNVTLYRKSAGHSAITPAASVSKEYEPAIPERTMPEPEAKRIHSGKPSQGTPTGSEIKPQRVISHEQAVPLYEQGRDEDTEQVIARLPPQNSASQNSASRNAASQIAESQNLDRASSLLLLAHSYANQGKLATALVCCDKAIVADKMAARAYYLRATILEEQGSTPEALLALQQSVYADPRFVLGHLSLGNLALKYGRLKESEKHFENVLLLLAHYELADIVPESGGLTAGRLREAIVLRRRGVFPIVPGIEPLQAGTR